MLLFLITLLIGEVGIDELDPLGLLPNELCLLGLLLAISGDDLVHLLPRRLLSHEKLLTDQILLALL